MEIAVFVILLIIGITCLVLSILHFAQKGGLLNNVFLFESKEHITIEEKKPLFIQSGIVFLLVGISFVLDALQVLFEQSNLLIISITLLIITFIFIIITYSKYRKERN